MANAFSDILGFAIAFGVLALALSSIGPLFFGKARKKIRKQPTLHAYRSRSTILSEAERLAFRQLYRALRGRAYLCPKVRIADILDVERTGDFKKDNPGFLRIAQKHVDFLVTDFDGQILFAIELDDSSHNRAKTIKRDELVNHAFTTARVDLIRVQPGKLSESRALRKKLSELPVPDRERQSAA
ncbi:DUF2726 domain-containing protein [Ponticaulis profundi]|uniref:DUF2726 domain-containing protein n=1 Tax=Ponticaulis profundi TaxID=2665222 RepID=A0ABW1S8Y7_9PROT